MLNFKGMFVDGPLATLQVLMLSVTDAKAITRMESSMRALTRARSRAPGQRSVDISTHAVSAIHTLLAKVSCICKPHASNMLTLM